MSNAIENLKKLHSAMSIEQKDISLQDLVANEGTDGVVEVEIVGFASKFVSKYLTAENKGMHTMVYLKDGRKTGGFSNALFEFATFFYKCAGMDVESNFNKIMFDNDNFIKVKISKIKLDSKKSTYNFELMDGDLEADNIERLGGVEGEVKLLQA